jgi:hypothetical protein
VWTLKKDRKKKKLFFLGLFNGKTLRGYTKPDDEYNIKDFTSLPTLGQGQQVNL